MATGYTSKLHDGEQSTKEFILLCARAFGATIHQRDDDNDVLPKHDEVRSGYHEEALVRTKAELAKLRVQTDEEAMADAEAAYAQAIEHWNAENERTAALKARYESMLQAIQGWTPPTKDHEGLKTFMVEQLTSSIEFDCRRSSWDTPPVLQSWAERRAEKIKSAEKSIVYYTEEIQKELDRVNGRNQWIDDLFESVKGL